MAEIRIQRKRRRKVWPLLLASLVLALVPLFFVANRRSTPASIASARRDSVPRTASVAASDTPAARDTIATRETPSAGRPTGVDSAPRLDTASRVVAAAGGAIASAPPRAPSTVGVTTAVLAATRMSAFERLIATPPRRANEQAQRRYTADALRGLASELQRLGASTAGVREIRANADSLSLPSIQGAPGSDHARAAFIAAVREFDVLRARRRATIDTARLRSAAWAVGRDRRLVAERAQVQRFFERARDALHTLSRRD